MTAEVATFPEQSEALALHARLLDGDPTASAALAEAYLAPLAQALKRMEPRAGDDDRHTAAEDAILSLIKNPASYDPTRGPLDTFLRMAAKRDLQNVQRAEHRHRQHRADWGAVEVSPEVGHALHDPDADPAKIVELSEWLAEERERRAIPSTVLTGLDEKEREALALITSGERRTERYAQALGITHLPLPEQKRQVKQVKDRLKQRVKRAGGHDG